MKLATALWLVYHYSGARAIWERINPPQSSREPRPASFVIWVIGVYAASSGIAAGRYEARTAVLWNRASSIYAQLSTGKVKAAISRIPPLQNEKVPYQPDFADPFSVLRSLFGAESLYPPLVEELKMTICDWKESLRGANLENAILDSTDLSSAMLDRAELSHANLRGADLSGASIVLAKLRHTNLIGANLAGARLDSSNLKGADLRGADLHKADLTDAILAGTDLRGANLQGYDVPKDLLALGVVVMSMSGDTLFSFDEPAVVSAEDLSWARFDVTTRLPVELWRQIDSLRIAQMVRGNQ